jgi:hypothetical protein
MHVFQHHTTATSTMIAKIKGEVPTWSCNSWGIVLSSKSYKVSWHFVLKGLQSLLLNLMKMVSHLLSCFKRKKKTVQGNPVNLRHVCWHFVIYLNMWT